MDLYKIGTIMDHLCASTNCHSGTHSIVRVHWIKAINNLNMTFCRVVMFNQVILVHRLRQLNMLLKRNHILK